ncbi:unnamed protein product [Ectocarpus sp. CCAP 1310/34]|nr:unnamed protein product [Ectocarpus sp. CCAP 1310/34]
MAEMQGQDDAPADSDINSNSCNNDRVGGGTSVRPLPARQELGTRISSVAARTTTALSETKEAEHEDNRGQARDEKEDLVHIPDDSAYVAASTRLGPPVSAAGATLAAEGATRHASGVAGDHGSRSKGVDNGGSQANDAAATVELNKYLWRLEEKRQPLGGCDTSLPPTGDNQGEAGQPNQQQSWASRDAATKVLSARDVMDRRSILEYAAALGKASHFEDLARWLRWKLGVGSLVNQLREPGVDGAPLLFQAVNVDECFKAVTKASPLGKPPCRASRTSNYHRVLLDTLGAGGVAQQIRATDQKGMTLLMHVARSAGSVEVFSSALHLVKTLSSRQQGLCHLRARDAEGRTLAHHAAEGRTEEMLPKVMEVVSQADLWVIDESDSESTDLRQYLSTRTDRQEDACCWFSFLRLQSPRVDSQPQNRHVLRHGRSPALCALGRKGTPRASLEKSIRVLLAGAPPSGSTTLVNNDADAAEGHLPIPAASTALCRRLRLIFQAPEGGGGKGGRGNSPLCWVLHAARGGIEV